jgi:hypothetical protein
MSFRTASRDSCFEQNFKKLPERCVVGRRWVEVVDQLPAECQRLYVGPEVCFGYLVHDLFVKQPRIVWMFFTNSLKQQEETVIEAQGQ